MIDFFTAKEKDTCAQCNEYTPVIIIQGNKKFCSGLCYSKYMWSETNEL